MKDRALPLQPNRTVALFYEQGKYFAISLSSYSFIPMCCVDVICIFIPFHVQETKGQVAQHRQKKAPPFPALCSYMRGRSGPFFYFDSNLSLYSSVFQNCCYPISLAGDVQKQIKRQFFLQEACSQTSQTPKPLYKGTHAHTSLADFKDGPTMQNYSQQLHQVRLKAHFILHPTETKSRYLERV